MDPSLFDEEHTAKRDPTPAVDEPDATEVDNPIFELADELAATLAG